MKILLENIIVKKESFSPSGITPDRIPKSTVDDIVAGRKKSTNGRDGEAGKRPEGENIRSL